VLSGVATVGLFVTFNSSLTRESVVDFATASTGAGSLYPNPPTNCVKTTSDQRRTLCAAGSAHGLYASNKDACRLSATNTNLLAFATSEIHFPALDHAGFCTVVVSFAASSDPLASLLLPLFVKLTRRQLVQRPRQKRVRTSHETSAT
jgi:hypothetical protein